MSETTWQVLAMRPSDLPGVHLIESQAPSPWSLQQLTAELNFPQAIQLVCLAQPGGYLGGFIMARIVADEAEILKIAAARDYHRQGIASLLLEAFIALARTRGGNTFYLELRAQNIPARALYEKHAFSVTGRRPNYYNDPQDDALCMSMSATP